MKHFNAVSSKGTAFLFVFRQNANCFSIAYGIIWSRRLILPGHLNREEASMETGNGPEGQMMKTVFSDVDGTLALGYNV